MKSKCPSCGYEGDMEHVPRVKKINEFVDQSETPLPEDRKIFEESDDVFEEMPDVEFESGEFPLELDPLTLKYEMSIGRPEKAEEIEDDDFEMWPPGC